MYTLVYFFPRHTVYAVSYNSVTRGAINLFCQLVATVIYYSVMMLLVVLMIRN